MKGTIERYGLRLVEAYVTQISDIRDRNPFQSCFPLPLSVPPPVVEAHGRGPGLDLLEQRHAFALADGARGVDVERLEGVDGERGAGGAGGAGFGGFGVGIGIRIGLWGCCWCWNGRCGCGCWSCDC